MTKPIRWERCGGLRWTGGWRNVITEDKRGRVTFSTSRSWWLCKVDGKIVAKLGSRDGAMRKVARVLRGR